MCMNRDNAVCSYAAIHSSSEAKITCFSYNTSCTTNKRCNRKLHKSFHRKFVQDFLFTIPFAIICTRIEKKVFCRSLLSKTAISTTDLVMLSTAARHLLLV